MTAARGGGATGLPAGIRGDAEQREGYDFCFMIRSEACGGALREALGEEIR
jgi:hypothetical protein